MKFKNKLKKEIILMSKCYLFILKEINKINRVFLWLLVFSILIVGLIPILSQYIFKLIILELENIINSKCTLSTFSCISLSAIYLLTVLLKSTFLNIRKYMSNFLSFELVYNIKSMLIKKIKQVEYENFYFPNFQNMYTVILQNCQTQPYTVVSSTVLALSEFVHFLSVFTAIIMLNPFILFLLTLCFFPSLIINIYTKREYIKKVDESALPNRKVDYFFQIMTEKEYIKEQRLFNLYPFFTMKRNLNFKKILNLWKQFRKKEFAYRLFSNFLPCIGIFMSSIFLISEVTKKRCTIPDFIFFIGIIISLQDIFESFTYDMACSYESMTCIRKLLDFLHLKVEIKSGNKKLLNKNRHTLEFIGVYFSYPSANGYTLKNINLKIKTGEIISLVGKNGCGKTTLIQLILRIYKPQKGKILLDGIN